MPTPPRSVRRLGRLHWKSPAPLLVLLGRKHVEEFPLSSERPVKLAREYLGAFSLLLHLSVLPSSSQASPVGPRHEYLPFLRIDEMQAFAGDALDGLIHETA